jgi:hypothetical protein
MQILVSKLIDELNSSVFVLLAMLAASFLMAFRVGKWTQQFSHQDQKINVLESLSEKIIVLQTKVDLIYQNTHPNKVLGSFSPTSLTETGLNIARHVNASKILDQHFESLDTLVQAQQPKTAYDIQVAAFRIAKEGLLPLLDSTTFTALKNEAYSNGILLEDILMIFGVLLRNKILMRSGISM